MREPWTVEAAEVVANEAVDPTMHHLVLRAPTVALNAAPGQFVTLALPDLEPLLPRPFDLHFADPESGHVEFIFRVKGRGTGSLAALRPGSQVQLQGPFGNTIDHLLPRGGRIALVGRGAGISPLSFIAQRAAVEGSLVFAYLSARNQRLLAPFDRLRNNARVFEQNDDQHPGNVVTDRLRDDLEQEPIDIAFVVGSQRLSRAVVSLGERYGFPVFGFAESFMPCGFGHCKACAIPTRSGGYLLACMSGPVIEFKEVSDEYWAVAPT